MAELQASWISASSHPADTDRLVLEGLMNPPGAAVSGAKYGVGTGSTELQVTENGTPNMTVNVAAGHAWIDGTENGNQGAYHVYNDASKSLTITAAHATLARKDLIVAKVQDAAYSGATNAWSLAVVTGTAASSPSEPTVPANAIVLAMIDVPAADTTITNSQITDRRRRAVGLGGTVVCTSGSRPAAPYEGQVIYETDTDKVYVYSGSAWGQVGLRFSPPACRVFHSAAQSIADVTETTVAFDSERFDTDTMHDTVTNNSRITFNTAGLYLVSFVGEFASAVDYFTTYALCRLNGSTVIGRSPHNRGDSGDGSSMAVTYSTSYKFAANDYVETRVYHNNSANVARNLLSTGNFSPEFSAVWIGTGA